MLPRTVNSGDRQRPTEVRGEPQRLEAEAFSILAPTAHDVRFTFRSALTMNVAHHTGAGDSIASFGYAGAPESHAEEIGFIGQIALARALVSADRLDDATHVYRGLGPRGDGSRLRTSCCARMASG